MYPHDVVIFGVPVSAWYLPFFVGAVLGYGLLAWAYRIAQPVPRPRWMFLRYAAVVYLAGVGAQFFAYLFDVNTTLAPDSAVSWVRYYFDPFYGPKTVYGGILAIPLGIWLCFGSGERFRTASERAAPALLFTVAIGRLGCFLQGCCYGVGSERFGLSFPPGSPAYYDQWMAGQIPAQTWSTPVVPTQLISTAVLLALSAWSWQKLKAGRSHALGDAMVAYSVFRFGLEFLRGDFQRNEFGPFSTSQWIAVAVVLGVVAWRRWRAPQRQLVASGLGPFVSN